MYYSSGSYTLSGNNIFSGTIVSLLRLVHAGLLLQAGYKIKVKTGLTSEEKNLPVYFITYPISNLGVDISVETV